VLVKIKGRRERAIRGPLCSPTHQSVIQPWLYIFTALQTPQTSKMRATTCAVLWLAATAASAHFVLDYPTSIGFDDEKLDQGPCGSFSATIRTKGVTRWSVDGSNIAVLTTHGRVTWELNVALVDNPTEWRPLVREFGQTGVGNVCFRGVPGLAAWIGQPAVLQVVQHGHHGVLYQCAAIEMVAGGPDTVPSGCTNSNGVSIEPLVPVASASTSAAAATTLELSMPPVVSDVEGGSAHHGVSSPPVASGHTAAGPTSTPTPKVTSASTSSSAPTTRPGSGSASASGSGFASASIRPSITAPANALGSFETLLGAMALLAAVLVCV